jgi:hypothetical protein
LQAVEKPRNPIFIVGASHSGTSLFNRLIGTHPAIFSKFGESNAFLYPRATEEILRRFLEDFGNGGERRFVEKTPRHFEHIDEILERFPQAQFIYVVRHPLDVCASWKRRTGNISTGLLRWKQAGRHCLGRYAFYPAVKVSRYEDLVSEPRRELKMLFDFIGETDADLDSILNFHLQPIVHEHATVSEPEDPAKHHLARRIWQVNQAIFDGRDRYRHELDQAEYQRIQRHCGELAYHFGYTDLMPAPVL